MTETPLAVRPREIDRTELEVRSRGFETASATEIVTWAHERFGDGLAIAASFQDCVLIDVATKVDPAIEVIFLDTQYHFAETLWYVGQVRRRYDLNLTVVEPEVRPDDRWQVDVDDCCRVRKIEPLRRALAGKAAWMGGLRRSESPTRGDAPVVSWDERRGLVKINPLANWTDADIEGYVRDHDLPRHPLNGKGYPSVGCWPCTDPVAPGEDPRAGRWRGHEKLECGINATD